MTSFAVDVAELQRCDALLSAAAGQAHATLARVRASGAAIVGSSWRGAAASDFAQAWEQWLAGAAALVGALEALAGAVGLAGADYATTEDAVRADAARTPA
jgi:WXG100 family type VII secretion target